MKILDLLKKAVASEASDVFIIAGLPASYRQKGALHQENDEKLSPATTREFLECIYEMADNRDISPLLTKGDDDFSFAVEGLSRFRVSAYKQRGTLSAVIRIITFTLPSYDKLHIPKEVIQLGQLSKGLVLVTGPAGSGKSTTLACIVDEINRTASKHIITLEDPIEYLHMHRKSIVSQRELNVDTESYATALRASLRQSPDVILLGEMRDYETMSIAMTAAETGHLVISTLHTIGAANTIDRIIDVFPANQQQQIMVQLSMVLSCVVSQQLVSSVNNDLLPALEIMTVTPGIRNMIRDNKIPQIDGLIYSSNQKDMISMDNYLLKLYQNKKITREAACSYASHPEMLEKKLP